MAVLYLFYEVKKYPEPKGQIAGEAVIFKVSKSSDDSRVLLLRKLQHNRKPVSEYPSMVTSIIIGDDRNLYIPQEVTYRDGIYMVTSLNIQSYDLPTGLSIDMVVIPQSINKIKPTSLPCEGFCAEENSAYYTYDGVLFSKPSCLVCYPKLRPGKVYQIPDGTKCIGPKSFSWCGNLHQINISTSVNTISADAFTHCKHIEELVIPDDAVIKTTLLESTLPKLHGDQMWPAVVYRGNKYKHLYDAWEEWFKAEFVEQHKKKLTNKRPSSKRFYDDDDIIDALSHGTGDMLGFGD